MRWNYNPKPPQEKISSLTKALKIPPLIAQLLVARGIETFEEARLFFRPALADLHDPYLMKDMDKAVNRIEKSIANGENIMVFGDYDVDGTTAVSLMASYLKSIYPNVTTYIPDRYTEGYGISFKGIDYADDNAISLIIALDCGIKSIDHVTYARERNIDFVICDHHRPGESLPDAVAVLDPKRIDCTYPYDELCGCGIGFKLIQALGMNRNQTVEDLKPYLDLVATAIAADIVPMTGENRILAKFGLEVINSNPRPGIKALIGPIQKAVLTITDVVFILAPRINAAGRIKHGNHAVELLSEFDIDQAKAFAAEIEKFNANRKELDKQMTAEALQQIAENDEVNRYSTVVFQEDWHKGVIGIVASRLIETYYRPTLVFTKSGDKMAASARSVLGFDVYNALEACSEHLEQFGGHMYAAGMTLLPENYEKFKEAFEKQVEKTITQVQLEPQLNIDLQLNFEDIDTKFVRLLKEFEPFGPQNMSPVFVAKDVFDTGYAKTMGTKDEHLKLFLKQHHSEGFAAIGFNLGDQLPLLTNRKLVDVAFNLSENVWRDQVSLQLIIKDIHFKD
ncbi:single-stranded-DNA-specific exonuclease RecJ [Flavobacterium sp.]|uniref:single-stranded-DNA-specific exonuclease RecJ n=1 Tax=Flavobacterium sp. TaxID=239 RepID=UPI00262ACDAA|nr:single-stranded-DNA-specific exonuclease RecJ [Flavobacterium sp.]MDD3005400.1 single-stranded-DNA-specific exonuclease RecJ [Flavobacterium sp.]